MSDLAAVVKPTASNGVLQAGSDVDNGKAAVMTGGAVLMTIVAFKLVPRFVGRVVLGGCVVGAMVGAGWLPGASAQEGWSRRGGM